MVDAIHPKIRRLQNFTRKEDKLKTKIREYRNLNSITQKQLANLVHVSTRTIISIEKGQYNPSLMLAYRVARVFNTTIEEICCMEENLLEEEKKYEIV